MSLGELVPDTHVERGADRVRLVVLDDRQPEEQVELDLTWDELNERVEEARKKFSEQVRRARTGGWSVLASSWALWWPYRPSDPTLEDAL